jgi:hemolysin activation/secretion protein
MPFNSTILWRNQFQVTNYNMLAVESFQLGGISNVRAYAPAEYVGDQGLTSTVEWSFPPYFMPKNVKVPFSKATFYDSLRLVGFYDLGYTHVNNTSGGAIKPDKTIQGWGFGLRMMLPEDCFVRLEVAYRFSGKSTFESGNGYLDVGKKF